MAAKAYGQAIALMPKEAMFYRNQASACINALQFDKARAILEKAQQLQPNHLYLPLHQALYDALESKGTEALTQTETALKHPSAPHEGVYLVKAWAFLLLEHSQKAVEAAKKVVELTTNPHDFKNYIAETERFHRAQPQVKGLAEALKVLKDAGKPD